MPLTSSLSIRQAASLGEYHMCTVVLRRCGACRSSALSLRSGAAAVTSVRCFGNAPSRIRPVEVPQEHALRQSEREISASIVIVLMMVIPLWLFVLSAESQDKKRESVREWAMRQRAARRPVAEEGADEGEKE